MGGKIIVAIILLLGFTSIGEAQTGSAHGNSVTWVPGVSGADVNTLVGANVYRCPGTCTVTSSWTRLNSAVLSAPAYLDPAANLAGSTTYSYAVTEVDSLGNESSFSNIVTLTTPATFPANPQAPTSVKVVSL